LLRPIKGRGGVKKFFVLDGRGGRAGKGNGNGGGKKGGMGWKWERVAQPTKGGIPLRRFCMAKTIRKGKKGFDAPEDGLRLEGPSNDKTVPANKVGPTNKKIRVKIKDLWTKFWGGGGV